MERNSVGSIGGTNFSKCYSCKTLPNIVEKGRRVGLHCETCNIGMGLYSDGLGAALSWNYVQCLMAMGAASVEEENP